MTFEEFKNSITEGIKNYPPNWRYGQKIFNFVDEHYNVARKVQFMDNIDCFYDDSMVETFLIAAYKTLMEKDN